MKDKGKEQWRRQFGLSTLSIVHCPIARGKMAMIVNRSCAIGFYYDIEMFMMDR